MKSLPSAAFFQPAAINPVLGAQTQTCVPQERKKGKREPPVWPHLSSPLPPLTPLSLTWMRPTSGPVGAGTRLHPAGIHDSCSFSFPGAVSCHQPFAIVQELLGFCPLQGIRDFIAARKEAVRGAWSRWGNCP